MYIIIVCLLVVLSLFLINTPKLRSFRNRHKRTFEFFISLISTFTGFFVALSLSSILSDVNQKKNLVKLLTATNLSIESSEMRTKGMYLNPASKGADINALIQQAPVEMPKLYGELESNSLVSEYFSSNGFQAYILCSDNMETFVMNANIANVPAERKTEILNEYLTYLNLAKQINLLEINKLKGDLSQSKEDEEIKKLTQQLK
ncbi:hypothetical protein [Chryseobacterium daeguense]|uniref:hypothetical protein n=1 Tax=Chryseobacterium daeguense TaxID=412438 RepID=UPI00041C4731|nr:hypothetical protein [Chryseobacterium daeguense]